jgi:hypothetical protein
MATTAQQNCDGPNEGDAGKVIVAGEEEGERLGFETETIDGVIADVKAAWSVVRDMIVAGKVNPLSPESVANCSRDLMTVDNGRYRNLIETYPVLTKHMISTGDINDQTLKKYFNWVRKNVWTSQEQFLEVQARYYYFLGRTAGQSKENAEKAYEFARDELLREDKEFKAVAERAQREYNTRQIAVKETMAAELAKLAQVAAQAGLEGAAV